MRTLLAVWDYWRTKRHNDPERLPLLSRLRREAAEKKAMHARLSSAHTELFRLRSHLVRVRHLLSLVKRREKLKHQIAALGQARAPRLELTPARTAHRGAPSQSSPRSGPPAHHPARSPPRPLSGQCSFCSPHLLRPATGSVRGAAGAAAPRPVGSRCRARERQLRHAWRQPRPRQPAGGARAFLLSGESLVRGLCEREDDCLSGRGGVRCAARETTGGGRGSEVIS